MKFAKTNLCTFLFFLSFILFFFSTVEQLKNQMKSWLENRLNKTCPVDKKILSRPASVGPGNCGPDEATIKASPRSAISQQLIVITNQSKDDSDVKLTSKVDQDDRKDYKLKKFRKTVNDRPKSCINYVKDFHENLDYFMTSTSPSKAKSETQLAAINNRSNNFSCQLGIDPFLIGLSDEKIVRAEVYHYNGDSCSEESDHDNSNVQIMPKDNAKTSSTSHNNHNGDCESHLMNINSGHHCEPPEIDPVNDLMKTLRCNSLPNDGDYRNSPFSDSGFRSKYSPSPKECPIAGTPLYHPHTKEPYITPSDPPIGLPPPHPALLLNGRTKDVSAHPSHHIIYNNMLILDHRKPVNHII